MSKFKLGDKVVVVKSDWGVPVGHRTYISRISDDMFCPYGTPTVYEGDPNSREDDDPWNESELELEEIYDSPLSRAMREGNES